MGGAAALLAAVTWLVGFVVFLGILAPAGYFDEGIDPAEKVAIIADNQAMVSLSYLVPFVVFGIVLIVLALALYNRLKGSLTATVQTATIVGLIWSGLVIASGMVANVGISRVVDLNDGDPALAGSVWLAVETVVLGLGGGNEVAGGVWVLLISWVALRARELPRALNYLGIVAGLAGIITVVPLLDVLGAVEAFGLVFGLGTLVWFIWLGIFLLRESPSATHGPTSHAIA
ncbi:MAG: DUF4386 family protein [Sphaerobacteraceae bacterium]|nr:MAG: DUF4386 family protein [Sphaerobacteraceae bacterium]